MSNKWIKTDELTDKQAVHLQDVAGLAMLELERIEGHKKPRFTKSEITSMYQICAKLEKASGRWIDRIDKEELKRALGVIRQERSLGDAGGSKAKGKAPTIPLDLEAFMSKPV